MGSRGLLKPLLFTLPFALLSGWLLSAGSLPADWPHRAGLLASFLVFNGAFFMSVLTGRTDRWRAPLFIAVAVLFAVSFMGNMLELHAKRAEFVDFMFRDNVPMCPIVIPMLLVPAALGKTILWPGAIAGTYAAVGLMFAIWLGASLALGKAWCGWGCFFGGLDDAFSRLLPRRLLSPPERLKWLPYAVLIIFALLTAASLLPAYCGLACPVKAATELPAGDFVQDRFMMWVHLLMFAGVTALIPALTKRRAQCAFFCPLGALQNGMDRLAPFEVRVDAGRCVKCGACWNGCPVMAITPESAAAGRTGPTCVKCGRCADGCRAGAISFAVKGAALKPETSRLLFLYPAFLFLTGFGGSIAADAVARLIILALTGRMF
jgi:polyferredoxin